MSLEPWELSPDYDLRRHCRLAVLIRRLASLCGIALAPEALAALDGGLLGRFVSADIVRLEPRVKPMNVVEISSAIALSMQAASLQQRPQEQERLFTLAYRKFESAANASPSNMTTHKVWPFWFSHFSFSHFSAPSSVLGSDAALARPDCHGRPAGPARVCVVGRGGPAAHRGRSRTAHAGGGRTRGGGAAAGIADGRQPPRGQSLCAGCGSWAAAERRRGLGGRDGAAGAAVRLAPARRRPGLPCAAARARHAGGTRGISSPLQRAHHEHDGPFQRGPGRGGRRGHGRTAGSRPRRPLAAASARVAAGQVCGAAGRRRRHGSRAAAHCRRCAGGGAARSGAARGAGGHCAAAGLWQSAGVGGGGARAAAGRGGARGGRGGGHLCARDCRAAAKGLFRGHALCGECLSAA